MADPNDVFPLPRGLLKRTRRKVPEEVTFGEASFKLLSEVRDDTSRCVVTTAAMRTPGGCVLRVTIQQKLTEGANLTTDLVYLPGVAIRDVIVDGEIVGRRLIPSPLNL